MLRPKSTDPTSRRSGRTKRTWFDSDALTTGALLGLAGAAMFAFVAGGDYSYWEAMRSGGGDGHEMTMELASGPGDDRFATAQAVLGLTPQRVEGLFPDLRTSVRDDGFVDGRFSVDGADYAVTFMEPERGGEAFRVRYVDVLFAATEGETREALQVQFGARPKGHCANAAGAAAGPCRFHWRTDDGIAMEVVTDTVPAATGEASASMTVTAIRSRP